MKASHSHLAFCDFAQPLVVDAPHLQCRLHSPVECLQAHNAQQLCDVLLRVEEAARQGFWCVGGLRYEAAGALCPELPTQSAHGPLAWFAVYEAPLQTQSTLEDDVPLKPALGVTWTHTVTRADFDQHVAQIKAAITDGAYYQVNYTQQLYGEPVIPVRPEAVFSTLQHAQHGGYGLYLDMGQEQIASVSPELFFDWHQPQQGSGAILTRPMKGTAVRGATVQLDVAQAKWLQSSVKERAENVMIVDLLRNDLGRIAITGSVHVPRLFNVQALPSVWQMTSDIRALLPAGTSLLRVLSALFPCGSVTGAPKRAAMQAIAQLELEPRGWYCGTLGVVRSDGAGGIRATFNVPIRTVVVDSKEPQQLRCGIGSAITADASAQGEWQEWRAKQAFLERVSTEFEVFTTMALEAGQLRHQYLHEQRLHEAAQHFGFVWNAQALQLTLQHVVDTHPAGLWRVRVALDSNGLFTSQVVACPALPAQVLLQLASEPLAEAGSEFVQFKTTRRAHYDRMAPAGPHVFDTILWNEDGQITEATRGNVVAYLDGKWVTPALSCGLLNGVGRQMALIHGQIQEGIIRLEDVPRVQHWAFLNSLRGWVPAQLVEAVSPVFISGNQR